MSTSSTSSTSTKSTVPFRVVIGSYSLAVGKIGLPTGRDPIVRQHDNVVDAMKDLHAAIQRNEDYHRGEAQIFQIVTPEGEMLALDPLYTRVFGEPPIQVDNKDSKYPWIFNKKPSKKA